MSDNLIKVAQLLSDMEYHDGTTIGEKLNITRAAVWKVIKKLEAYEIPIKSVKGKGYLLEDPLILLDQKRIKALLKTKTLDVEVLEKVDSTSEYLKNSQNKNKKMMVCVAETQTAGRGRLGRVWHSPFGQNIIFSLFFPFQKDISELSGLSLVVGLAVSKAVTEACNLAEPLSVKWPNDIVANQKKVGGNLIDIQAESYGFCNVIIGIGINVNMLGATKDQINQPWSSLRQLNGQYQDRNPICAAVIDQVLLYLKRFDKYGISDFMKEWQSWDCLYGKQLSLTSNKTIHSGVGSGINEQGHLLLTMPNNTKQAFASGETTILKQTV